MKNISPLYKFSLKGGGRDEQHQPKVQPSAEIVRVECAKCRRECDLSGPRATLCGDRACRVREMQARVRFVRSARNPLRRSCVSSAQNAARVRFVRSARNPLRRSRVSSARRARETQARVRFVRSARNPLRRGFSVDLRLGFLPHFRLRTPGSFGLSLQTCT